MNLHHNRRDFRLQILFFIIFVLASLVLAGCGGTTDENNQNGNDYNNDNGSVENGDETVPTDRLRDTIYYEYPGAINVFEETEEMLFFSTDETKKIMEFYMKDEQLVPTVGSADSDFDIYQTPLMLHYFALPMDPSAEDYEEKLDEWEQELERIIETDGNLMAIFIVNAENRDFKEFIDLVEEDNLGLIPQNAKTVMRYYFGEFDS